MPVKIVKVLLALAVLGIGFSVFRACRSPAYVNFPPAARGEWIAFGDSLTAGFGASEGNDYPTLLSARLSVPIQNLGVPGETTQGGLNRVNQVAEREPRVVLLCFGGNDGLQSIPKEQMVANLAAIIDRLHQAGSFVVLIGVHSASIRDSNEKYFEDLADAKKVLYVPDILEGVLGHANLMSDYIHPNEAGYKVIATRLEGILLPLLSELRN